MGRLKQAEEATTENPLVNAGALARMRIEQEPFYYFSDEFFDPVFPVKCYFINWLRVTDSPIWAMQVRAEVPFGKKKLVQFILLPKGE